MAERLYRKETTCSAGYSTNPILTQSSVNEITRQAPRNATSLLSLGSILGRKKLGVGPNVPFTFTPSSYRMHACTWPLAALPGCGLVNTVVHWNWQSLAVAFPAFAFPSSAARLHHHVRAFSAALSGKGVGVSSSATDHLLTWTHLCWCRTGATAYVRV